MILCFIDKNTTQFASKHVVIKMEPRQRPTVKNREGTNVVTQSQGHMFISIGRFMGVVKEILKVILWWPVKATANFVFCSNL